MWAFHHNPKGSAVEYVLRIEDVDENKLYIANFDRNMSFCGVFF